MAATTATYEWTTPDSETGAPIVSFNVRFEQAELDRLLAAYDPNSGTSPGVSDARPVVRAILNAALAGRDGGAQ